MAESSSQNPSSPNITSKEEPDTQEKPKSPNPFLPADRVEFTFDQITFSTNNEVALLYHTHPNTEYFEIVLDFILKWRIRGEIGITTFRNALRAHYLPHSSRYVTPSLAVVRTWFATIGYSREIGAKGTLKKSFLPPRFFHFHYESASGCDALANSTTKADPGKSAPNDSIPSQQGMDKGTKNHSTDHIFARTNPSILVDKTKSARDRLKTTHTDLGTNEESRSDEISKKIKLEDLLDLMQDTRSAFLTPDSLQDEPIIVSDESEEEETKRYKDTHTTSHDGPEDTSIPHPPSPKSVQIQELMAQVHLLQSQKDELEQQKELPAEFLVLPNQISLVQEKLKTLDALPSLLNKVTVTLYRFTSLINQSSQKAKDKGVPSAGKSNASPAEREKNTYSATKEANLKNDLVDLMGIDVVEEYHKKSPITLKVYREDRTNEVISNFKVSDLHLAEWRKLQFFGYLEDQDHLHFSLCGSTETEDRTLASASVQLG
ncbi:hypothetical protein Tco_0678649 [Tanacetum coccineum]|uniref:Uncharacterized protein n=1 Tax=Tanacetum coccineum TaxID=301880 RepID=A0ABQ4XGB3_9ASTR